MTTSILMAGFGGQGIQFASKQIAHAGMEEDKYVTLLPSYGPETRGGTSTCAVIVSDEEIGSPIVSHPDILVAMNLPSFVKFESAVRPYGTIYADSSLINKLSDRDDLSVYYIPASKLAADNGLDGFANVIILGKIISSSKLFDTEKFLNYMLAGIPASKAALAEKNTKAYRLGVSFK